MRRNGGGIYNEGLSNYNTSIALSTLLRAGEERDERLIKAARRYLVGAQGKGGFTYSPEGGKDGTHSYGTMTYSGLLSLIHAKVDRDDPRVKAAVEWLSRHYALDENPGQGQAGLFYYYFVMAKALTAAGLDALPTADGEVDWRAGLARRLIGLQRPDGSWVNENGRWMEQDPVLVTGYAVLALNQLRHGK